MENFGNSWFEKVGLVCQTTCFCVVSWILGLFEANSNKNAVIFSTLPTGDTRINFRVLKTTLCIQKMNKKLPNNVKKTKYAQFSNIWVTLRKLSTLNKSFFSKTCFRPGYIISSFSKLLFYRNFPISKKISLKISEY